LIELTGLNTSEEDHVKFRTAVWTLCNEVGYMYYYELYDWRFRVAVIQLTWKSTAVYAVSSNWPS